jgi:hypothetical protein
LAEASTQGRLPLGVATMLGGIGVPVLATAVDFARGQPILATAPAGMLAVVAIAITALVLSAVVPRGSPSLAYLAGVLSAVSVAAWATAVPIVLLACFGAWFTTLYVAQAGLGGDRLVMIGLTAIGLALIWPAWVYTCRARLVIRAAAEAPHPDRALGRALLGALAVVVMVVGLDLAERRWLGAQIAHLSLKTPDRWAPTLDRLRVYPLCGKRRCTELVCDRLYGMFGETIGGGQYPMPNVPPEHEALFADYLGKRTGYSCARPN